MPSRVAVGPAQGRAVAAGAGLQRCDRGLPWAAIACGSAAACLLLLRHARVPATVQIPAIVHIKKKLRKSQIPTIEYLAGG